MKKQLLLTILSVMVCLSSFGAIPEAGKYYRIVNASYGTAISENITSSKLVCTQKGTATDYEQIWKIVQNGTKTAVQNAYTDRYIQPQSSQSNQFSTGKATATVTFSNASDAHFLMNSGGYLHCDASSNVVNWYDTSNEGDHWYAEEVTVDEDALAKAKQEFSDMQSMSANVATYTATLSGYFTDAACTELKSSYASMTDDALKASLSESGIPVKLQDVVVRIKNQWSDELNAEYSKAFRIQEYKCYPRAGEAKAYTRATQISDMNNITGIWTNAKQILYVFVEGDIPSNASLRLAQTTGDLGRAWYDQGTALKKGLNIIYCAQDNANNWIMYTVPFSKDKPISEYPKLKIHIEGGNVIGYTDVAGLDETGCNALWKDRVIYANKVMSANGTAAKNLDYAVRGEYGMMLFPLECYNQIWTTKSYNGSYTANYNIYKSMKFYDNVLMWEWGAMGITKRVLDGEAAPGISRENMTGGDDIVPTYVNNFAPAMMVMENGKNPYSSDGYTCMPGVGAVESSYNAERADFDTWCVGHESGHNNQGTINLESSMEASNNYFSNIITYLQGYRMSRGMNFDENYDQYTLTNTIFPHRSISITLRMYYNLYLYYHRCQKKTDFSTRLHQLLRKDPIKFSGNGWYDGPSGGANRGSAVNTWIKFYKYACEAAQEDLTEYFRLWGFFIPCKDAYCGDYTSYYVTLTQAEIDKAIAEVKSKGYPVNNQICFIEDRLQTQKRFDPWANGTSVKPDNGGTVRSTSWLQNYHGTLGYCDDYLPENFKSANYTYIASGTEIKLEGEGGVGVIVYDKDGNVGYMSNRLKFSIPVSLANDGYTIKAVNADGTMTDVTDASESGTAEQKKAALEDAIKASTSVTDLLDKTGKKVGYYSEESLSTLTDLVAQGNDAIKNGDDSKYSDLAKQINNETLRIKSGDAMLSIKSNGIYTIKSHRAQNRYLNSPASGALQTSTSATTKSSRWLFIPASDGNYYLQNLYTKNLLKPTYNSDSKLTGWTVTAENIANANITNVKSTGNGQFYFENLDGNCINLNGADNSSIAVWSEDAGSMWYITLVDEIDAYTLDDLKELTTSSNELVNRICDYSTEDVACTLQASDKSQPGYIWTNKPDADETHGVDMCIDNKSTTYFISDQTYTGNDAYLAVDLGKGNETDRIRFTYTSSLYKGSYKPAQIKVSGSATGTSYTTVETLNVTSSKTTYTSPEIKASKAYRYWRFTVIETNNESTTYFAVAKFGVSNVQTVIKYHAGYEGVDESLITAVKNEIPNTQSAISGLAAPLNYYEAYTALKTKYDALEAATSADAIFCITPATTISDGIIYNLQGQRVQNLQSGRIYIQNGKKFMAR